MIQQGAISGPPHRIEEGFKREESLIYSLRKETYSKKLPLIMVKLTLNTLDRQPGWSNWLLEKAGYLVGRIWYPTQNEGKFQIRKISDLQLQDRILFSRKAWFPKVSINCGKMNTLFSFKHNIVRPSIL